MDVDEQVEPMPGPVRPLYTQDMRASSVPIKPQEFTVGFVYSTEMMIHFDPNGHPEQPERISRIHDALEEARCLSKMKRLPIRPVRKEESLLVHSEDHWDKVRDIQSKFQLVLQPCWFYTSYLINIFNMLRTDWGIFFSRFCSNDGARN